MRRRLLNLLTPLSLLLCVVLCYTVVATWSESATINPAPYYLPVTAHAGRVSVTWQTDTPGDVSFRFLGIRYVRSQHTYSPTSSVSAPLWPLILLTAVPPASQWWRRRKQSRWKETGACQQCGYDLTGNVSGACPECGTEAPPVPSRQTPALP